MLDLYKQLEANGVIGKMMKVGTDGKPIVDVRGEIPGQMVARVHTEYPKVVRRLRADGVMVEKIVNSKSEELKLIAEAPDADQPLSPLERERDALARTVAEQDKALGRQDEMLGKMSEQMTALMAQVARQGGQGDVDVKAHAQGEAKGEAKAHAQGEAHENVVPATPSPPDAEARATRGFGALIK